MTSNYLFIAIILFFLLIAVDMGFYRLRVKRYDEGRSLFLGAQNFMARLGKWVAARAKSAFQPARKASVGPPPEVAGLHAPAVATVTETIEANSVQLQISAQIPEGTTVHVSLKIVDRTGKTTSRKSTLGAGSQSKANPTLQDPDAGSIPQTRRWRGLNLTRQFFANALAFEGLGSKNLNGILLVAALAVYALVVSVGIDRYPIYFFTDEAIHMNMASDFLRDHFQNYYHEFLPTYFTNEGWVNGTSVYLQVIPYLLFGKSIVVTRLVSAAVTLAGALALALLLKQTFKIKFYWAGALLLLTTPAWFLHARTAFEYAEVASFYSIFLYFYGRYRDGHLPSLYFAMIAGALTFYTHGLGQILMGTTGLALAVIDFRYHVHPDRRRTVLFGLGLALLLFVPFVRYYLAHSGESLAQMKRRDSYWINDNLTLFQKVWQFISQYAYGLNPSYWYFHNSVDIERHIMKGWGNGLWVTLPFAALGFFRSVWNIRRYQYRIALVAFLAAPIPSAIVAIGMPRMLWMAIPLSIFTMFGLSYCLDLVERHWKNISKGLPVVLFAILTSLSLFMLRDALVNGPTWSEDYGLYGMQYGAKQVFQETVVPDLEKDPNLIYVISPSWANGTEKFVDFFVPDSLRSRVSFGQPVDRINVLSSMAPNSQLILSVDNQESTLPLTPNPTLFNSNLRFVATSNEYDNLQKDPKFKDIIVYKVLPYPNGQPGFYILSLNVVNNIEEIISAEEAKNRTPVEDTLQLGGQAIRVLHSPIGSGDLNAVFDQNPDTLARVLEANPFTFDMYPATPLNTRSVTIQTGSLPNFTITIALYASDAATPVIYKKSFKDLPPDPLVSMTFDQGPSKSARIYIEIKDNLTGNSSQIHVRTIQFK